MNGPDATALARDLLAQEAACLDERRWDDWLSRYREDCEYWVPMWRDEETLTADPRRELSHIYYRSRAGLEDRVMRIKTRQSASSVPLPRTTHVHGWVIADPPSDADRLHARAAWSCHVFLPARQQSFCLFGLTRVDFTRDPDGWRIQRRVVQLNSDYIPTMIDVYCL
ncbi:aromatic-ring-hydroxylating dioxygenase subunit beta [Aquabacterium sp. J223]|uniref:aromatic-ring-hydroxylating dioxygenase subunit beta n=1 Tax=Aquabacterium sp. J223 TaxID=2898431 RepID=UPI0021ADB86C|nr:aromatic-ring-hydroxylating dioxygenase subunit beta [Aquabacterium sp. J223]UUX95341.1 aromatic-ring-hydroxylating dioxygenase subunit beta [Aquabacterium sp. J223]